MIFDPKMSTKLIENLRCTDELGPQYVHKNHEKPKAYWCFVTPGCQRNLWKTYCVLMLWGLRMSTKTMKNLCLPASVWTCVSGPRRGPASWHRSSDPKSNLHEISWNLLSLTSWRFQILSRTFKNIRKTNCSSTQTRRTIRHSQAGFWHAESDFRV